MEYLGGINGGGHATSPFDNDDDFLTGKSSFLAYLIEPPSVAANASESCPVPLPVNKIPQPLVPTVISQGADLLVIGWQGRRYPRHGGPQTSPSHRTGMETWLVGSREMGQAEALGKWVAEIRLPKDRTRLRLRQYHLRRHLRWLRVKALG
ncbi:hypothetical protein MLD38_034724 [Melastoma candidum]|uniref:Uncharacterized protein n=1 Tax=Melastoma candidum TaxID=119954 RepID=A0ACB9MAT4_9MYRT|nr:hypothetical protein MLD38_034724 [Melastoma candidum]